MQLQIRLVLTFFTLVGVFMVGAIGAWAGPMLGWWWLLPVVLCAFFFVLPWSPVVWSQEDLLVDMKAFLSATDELAAKRQKVEEMAEELEAAGGLSLEQVQQLGADFEEARTPSLEALKTLRELLFQAHRRMLVVQVLMLLLIALGGSLLTHVLAAWLGKS